MDQMDGFEDTGFQMDDTPMSSNSGGVANGVGTVKVKRTTYAIGLYWEGVDDPSSAVKTARERAGNADFFCVFNANAKTQIGLGQKAQGHKGSMPVLAPHIVKNRKGNFLALFEVDGGGYYILGVRDDGIDPLLERFVASRTEAEELFEDAKGQDWGELIAPDVFNWPDTVEVKIEDCIKGRPPVRLKDVNRSSNIIKFVALGIIVAAGVVGVQKYNEMSEQQRLQDELAAKLAQAKNAVLPNSQEQIKVPPPPWSNQPMGPYFIKACVDDIMSFPLDIPGWNVTDFQCKVEGGSKIPAVAAILKRGKLGDKGGSITWIEPYITDLPYKVSVTPSAAGSNDTVSAQWNILNVPKIPLDVQTAPVNQVKKALLWAFESRMTEVHYTLSADQFYRTITFDFSSTLDPREFIDLIAAIPGGYIDQIDFNISSNTWKIKGKAYEQLPLPTHVQK